MPAGTRSRRPGRVGPSDLSPRGSLFLIFVHSTRRISREAQRVDADVDLALPGQRDLNLFDAEDFGSADLLESYDSRRLFLPC
jgi:hypothetical protein